MKEDYKKRMQLIDQEEEKKIRIIREAKKRLNDERKRREKEVFFISIIQNHFFSIFLYSTSVRII